jgi:hypothetical protein
MFFKRSFEVVVITILLTGCAKWPVHKFSVQNTPNHTSDSLVIDAEKRVVLSGVRLATGKRINPQTNQVEFFDIDLPVVCAEPSPDAISAAALSLAAKANSADQVGAEMALSHAQSTSYIGLRTQTIQLLRDGMYRLCEGYLSGALYPESFNELHRRYQNLMMGLLAVELLTNTVVAPQVSLQSSLAAANAGGGAEVKNKLNDYANAKATSEITAKENQAAQDALKINQSAIASATDDAKKADAQRIYNTSVKVAAELAHKHRVAQITEEYYKDALATNTQGNLVTQSSANSGSSFVQAYGSSKDKVEPDGISKAVIEIVRIIISESFQKEECNRRISSLTGLRELSVNEQAMLKHCMTDAQEKADQLKSIQEANEKVQTAAPAEKEQAKEEFKKSVDQVKKIIMPLPEPSISLTNPTSKPCIAVVDTAQSNKQGAAVENPPIKEDTTAAGAAISNIPPAPCEVNQMPK